jgi:hypothetical protein
MGHAASNGEVEGPRACAQLEPRVHDLSRRPRREQWVSLAPRTIVRLHICVRPNYRVAEGGGLFWALMSSAIGNEREPILGKYFLVYSLPYKRLKPSVL